MFDPDFLSGFLQRYVDLRGKMATPSYVGGELLDDFFADWAICREFPEIAENLTALRAIKDIEDDILTMGRIDLLASRLSVTIPGPKAGREDLAEICGELDSTLENLKYFSMEDVLLEGFRALTARIVIASLSESELEEKASENKKILMECLATTREERAKTDPWLRERLVMEKRRAFHYPPDIQDIGEMIADKRKSLECVMENERHALLSRPVPPAVTLLLKNMRIKGRDAAPG